MSFTLSDTPEVLRQPGYVARLTTRDGKEIEKALAGDQVTLLSNGADLDGALVEASYAAARPPLLKRLGDTGVTRLLETECLRFTGSNFLETAKLTALPYAPKQRITSLNFEPQNAIDLGRGSLDFAQQVGADIYIAPGLPLPGDDLPRWRDHNERLLEQSSRANGSEHIERKPLLAFVAPGDKALRDPAATIDRLLDYPIAGVYLQPLRLQPLTASVETLARFVQFAHAIHEQGLPVMVARVGAFGLVLQALNIDVFDSGLGSAESSDVAGLTRSLTEKARLKRQEEGGFGPAGRMYLEPLKTTTTTKIAMELHRRPNLVGQLMCNRGCCQFHTPETIPARARQHFLYTRREEVDAMRAVERGTARLHEVEHRLREARDFAKRVNRTASDVPKLPKLGHIDTWLGLLAREHALAAAG